MEIELKNVSNPNPSGLKDLSGWKINNDYNDLLSMYRIIDLLRKRETRKNHYSYSKEYCFAL